MRIHSNKLQYSDLWEAAQAARVDMDMTRHGSRSHEYAFNVKLTGESKRRPNSGKRGAGDDFAATWDQWGVFIAILFDKDPSIKMTHYENRHDFHVMTNNRFLPYNGKDAGGHDHVPADLDLYWPADAHGDHRFEWEGVPRQRKCKKCSATQNW